MRIRWRGLELPSRVLRDEQVSTDTYGKFVAEPFERGFGTTIIERSIPFDLSGDAELRFDLLGVQARFVIPAQYVQVMTMGSGIAARAEATAPSGNTALCCRNRTP